MGVQNNWSFDDLTNPNQYANFLLDGKILISLSSDCMMDYIVYYLL